MNPKRWNYLKALTPPAPVMVHKSCDAYMVPDPFNPMGPMRPFVSKGETYNVGSNKAKAQRRAAKRQRRTEWRAKRRQMLAEGWVEFPKGTMVQLRPGDSLAR